MRRCLYTRTNTYISRKARFHAPTFYTSRVISLYYNQRKECAKSFLDTTPPSAVLITVVGRVASIASIVSSHAGDRGLAATHGRRSTEQRLLVTLVVHAVAGRRGPRVRVGRVRVGRLGTHVTIGRCIARKRLLDVLDRLRDGKRRAAVRLWPLQEQRVAGVEGSQHVALQFLCRPS